MSKTPSKQTEDLHIFTPKDITSPVKVNSPGIPKTAYAHISNLHTLLSNWTSIRDKGLKICKSLSSLKLYECENDYYPHQTRQLVDGLLEALDALENILDGVSRICGQMKALAKLQPTNDPIINTWPSSDVTDNIFKIYESLQNELQLKKKITENIAHCRDEGLIEIYVSAWEFEIYFNIESNAYLFAEVGLPGITSSL